MSRLITTVDTVVVPSSRNTWLDETRVSTRLSGYPRFAQSRASWRGPGADAVSVRLATEDGCVGLGQSRGGSVTERLINDHVATLIAGQDSGDITARTDEIRLALEPYAAGALGSMAVSAVELALWDLAARRADMPLAELLGGSVEPLTPYLTSGDPQRIRSFGVALAEVPVLKVPMPYGPEAGEEGLRKNLDLLTGLGDELPDGTALAVDCFMSWTEPYTRRFVDRAQNLNLAWVEEPLPPDDWRGYQRLRGSLGSVSVAGGEHLYGVSEALRFLEFGCVDIIQTDVTWCGGIRTSLTIAAAAEACGVTFAPHDAGGQPWGRHLLGACTRRSLAEVLVRGDWSDDVYPVRPSDAPGVGVAAEQLGFRS